MRSLHWYEPAKLTVLLTSSSCMRQEDSQVYSLYSLIHLATKSTLINPTLSHFVLQAGLKYDRNVQFSRALMVTPTQLSWGKELKDYVVLCSVCTTSTNSAKTGWWFQTTLYSLFIHPLHMCIAVFFFLLAAL